jgi:hypothetical protein
VAVLPKKKSRSSTTTGEGMPAPLLVRDQRIAAVRAVPFGGVRSPRWPDAIAAAGDLLPGLDVPKYTPSASATTEQANEVSMSSSRQRSRPSANA